MIILCFMTYVVGGCLGSIYYSEYMEIRGRLKVIIESIATTAIACLLGFFSINIYCISVVFFFVSFGFHGFYSATCCYLMEICSENMRVWAPNIIAMGWFLGQVAISLLAKTWLDWAFLLILIVGAPLFVSAMGFRFMSESPRFLCVK